MEARGNNAMKQAFEAKSRRRKGGHGKMGKGGTSTGIDRSWPKADEKKREVSLSRQEVDKKKKKNFTA